MEIISKSGKLTSDEYKTIKEHAPICGDLVKNSPSLRPRASIIRHHHEFYNGEGYPNKLKGNQISIEARIDSVADAIEAITSDRPYRKALQKEQIIEELNRNLGSHFNLLVIKEAIKFLKWKSQLKTLLKIMSI